MRKSFFALFLLAFGICHLPTQLFALDGPRSLPPPPSGYGVRSPNHNSSAIQTYLAKPNLQVNQAIMCQATCAQQSDVCLNQGGTGAWNTCAFERVECLQECIEQPLSCDTLANAYADTLIDACKLEPIANNNDQNQNDCLMIVKTKQDEFLKHCVMQTFLKETQNSERKIVDHLD